MLNNLHARSDVLFGNLPSQGTLACEVWDTPEKKNQWLGLRIPLVTYQTLKRQGELKFRIHFFKSNKYINLTNWPKTSSTFLLVPWFPISGRWGPWVTCGRLDFKVGAATYLDTKKYILFDYGGELLVINLCADFQNSDSLATFFYISI